MDSSTVLIIAIPALAVEADERPTTNDCAVNLGVRVVEVAEVGEGGAACGRCDACLLRLKGFAEAGSEDPIRYQRMEKAAR